MNNKELVFKAITAVFVDRDITAFEQYFGENYIQHNPVIPNGTDALKQLLPVLPADFGYEPGVMAENGNIVMIHGRYTNWNGKNRIGVDIFRVDNGKLVEHWDVLQEEVTAENSANGNSMFPIVL
ncbi:nuclear transport factor 2 family protein [Chryseobacterium aureum]|uniref:nuclear transport factor 2 family protein n=1 Tax=Chryseobacterium aureum TaxID=2497456 RepID=UPI000F8636A9|nr:nuclear transport factor 2 family protein [Chryseobacterium aureum]